MCTLGIDSAVMMTMQPSLRTIKSLQPTSKISIWYQEKSHASNTRKKMREQGAGKESESSSFSPPHKASPLTRAFSCHSKWRGRAQSIIFLGNLARSPFGEPVYIRNSEEKFELFTHCQCPLSALWLHVTFFTHFNQPLTLINNSTTLTSAWHKISSHILTYSKLMTKNIYNQILFLMLYLSATYLVDLPLNCLNQIVILALF